MKNKVIFDLDGTLALNEHRQHLIQGPDKDWDLFYEFCDKDEPNEPIIRIYNNFIAAGYEPYIFSGRSIAVSEKTKQWFYNNRITWYKELVMRPADSFKADDKLKREWLDKYIPKWKEEVLCVFDDRDKVVKMWRDLGLVCLQVAPGAF